MRFLVEIYVNGCGWNIKVRYGIHNYGLVDYLNGHDIRGHPKPKKDRLLMT